MKSFFDKVAIWSNNLNPILNEQSPSLNTQVLNHNHPNSYLFLQLNLVIAPI